jgi:hypothetical protein
MNVSISQQAVPYNLCLISLTMIIIQQSLGIVHSTLIMEIDLLGTRLIATPIPLMQASVEKKHGFSLY